MSAWLLFWAAFLGLTLVVFAVLAVWVTFQGWRDLRYLLSRQKK